MLFDTKPLLTQSLLAAAVACTGCAKDPALDAPAAQVSEPAPAAQVSEPVPAPIAAPTPAAQPVEPAQPAAVAPVAPAAVVAAAAENAADAKLLTGTIAAVGSKVTGAHTIVFQKWTGTLRLNAGKPEGGQLAFTVDTASLVSDPDARNPFSEKLDGHLRSSDFFEAEKFPQATFTSSEIVTASEPGMTHTVKGNLTLRGTTKQVSFPATITQGANDIAGKAEFSINRKEFGIVYPGKPDDLIRDGVVLKVDVKAAL
jgi:polyisoprenoid-binding protein YceI